jgi:hypothetical protein
MSASPLPGMLLCTPEEASPAFLRQSIEAIESHCSFGMKWMPFGLPESNAWLFVLQLLLHNLVHLCTNCFVEKVCPFMKKRKQTLLAKYMVDAIC